MPADPRALDRHVEGVADAHQRLLRDLADFDDDAVARPSRLGGWSVGHVLAHIDQQGRSLIRLIDAAEAGSIADQYEGGMPARTAAIEELAGRTAAEHLEAIRRSIYEFEGRVARATVAWSGRARMVTGIEIPIADLPFRRWREVEVHAVDLGLRAAGTSDWSWWSADYVREDLRVLSMQYTARASMGRAELPESVRRRDERERLAWLLGRLDIEGCEPARIMG